MQRGARISSLALCSPAPSHALPPNYSSCSGPSSTDSPPGSFKDKDEEAIKASTLAAPFPENLDDDHDGKLPPDKMLSSNFAQMLDQVSEG